ncbi:MAG TPA: hypothetical protein VFM76_06355 [Methylophaga sp.]|nr:hypothetical protein [Methylophaga sp.]
MKLIGLLLVLLLVGWLLKVPLRSLSPPTEVHSHDESEVPRVPTTPQQLDEFDQNINQFVTGSVAKRARQIEQNQ